MYGMTDSMIEVAKQKVERNRSYLENNGLTIEDEFIPFSSFVTNTYTNAYRYVAELNNRVNALHEYAVSNDLVNVFFSLTLPSEWHPMKTLKNGKVVPNPLYDASRSPKDGSKELSAMLQSLWNDRLYRSIPLENRVFFRVTEPHKDGTPHLHVSFFIPEEYVPQFVEVLNRLYPEPLGKVVTDVRSPVAYLMKYILKTLDDLRDSDNALTDLTFWYVYHGIPRFFSSRTLIDLETYRKLNGAFSLMELTDLRLNGLIDVHVDIHQRRIVAIDIEGYTVYHHKAPKVLEYEAMDYFYYQASIERPQDFIRPPELWNDIPIEYETIFMTKKPYQMSDQELYSYFNSLDLSTVNPDHYCYTRNLISQRETGEWVSFKKEAERAF